MFVFTGFIEDIDGILDCPLFNIKQNSFAEGESVFYDSGKDDMDQAEKQEIKDIDTHPALDVESDDDGIDYALAAKFEKAEREAEKAEKKKAAAKAANRPIKLKAIPIVRNKHIHKYERVAHLQGKSYLEIQELFSKDEISSYEWTVCCSRLSDIESKSKKAR